MIDQKVTGEGKTTHNLVISNRKKVEMTGITDVGNFNEEYVLIHTEQGLMELRGTSLRIVKLDVENKKLSIEGNITAVLYDDGTIKKKASKNTWSK